MVGAPSYRDERRALDASQTVLDQNLTILPQSDDSPSTHVISEGRIARNECWPGQVFHCSDIARAVAAFHRAFDLPARVLPSADVDEELADLRVRLLAEEVGELRDATALRDIIGIADALADIVYVAYGTAVTYGIDLDAVLAEVHRANMSKLDADGRPVLRADGKVLKSARYRAPDVATVLAEQLPLPYGVKHRASSD